MSTPDADSIEEDAGWLQKIARRHDPSITPEERAAMEANGDPDDDWCFLSLPPPGEGHNSGLKRVADLLQRRFELSRKEAFDHIRSQYDRARPDSDIYRALDRVGKPSSEKRGWKFPPADPRLTAAAIEATDGSVGELNVFSFANTDAPPEDVLRVLMRVQKDEDPLVCVGVTAKIFTTLPLSEIAPFLVDRPYFVPQPMTARAGMTIDDPHLSQKCDGNTSQERLNIVVEFDKLSKDEQAAVIMFLSRFARLIVVCDSGGKSLHAFFNVANRPLKEQEAFMRVACQLGADYHLWTLSQFARIPGGLRPAVSAAGDNPGKPARRQTIIYYDPDAAEATDGWRIKELVEWAAEAADDVVENSPDDRLPPCYYDGTRFLLDNGRDYVPMDRRSISLQLERMGFTPAPEFICRIQMERFVKYFGPLAGRRRGLYESNGDLLLASPGPKIIEAAKGKFPTIKAFLDALLGGDDHAKTQLGSFMGWMKTARHALLAGVRRPGQTLVLAGPIQCGKTLLIKLVMLPALGGRMANPFRYLTGKTNFNGDLIGGELLVIDDETASTRIETRRALGDGIKSTLFSSSVRIEAKNKNAFHFDPLWRLVIAVNDVPESLLVLPPLSHDLADKLMILRCRKAVELHGLSFESWCARIAAELPAFLHSVEQFKIAPEDAEGRCGVKAFLHPDIVDAINELSAERRLRILIDTLAAEGGIELPWEGTAAQLRKILTAPNAATHIEAERLVGSWAAGIGVYLSRLSGCGVVKLKLLHGEQQWRIECLGENLAFDET